MLQADEFQPALGSGLNASSAELGRDFVKQRVKKAVDIPDMRAFRDESTLSAEIIALCASKIDSGTHVEFDNQGFKNLTWRAVARNQSVAVIIEWLRDLENIIDDFLYSQSDASRDEIRNAQRAVSALFNDLCNHQLSMFEHISDELAGWRTRASADLVSYLVSGTAVVPSVVNEQALSLALDPKMPFRAIAIHIDPLLVPTQRSKISRRLMRFVQEVNEQAFPLVQHRDELLLAVITPNRDNDELVATISDELLSGDLQKFIYVATGETVRQLSAAGKSCRQALSTLEIAMFRDSRGQVSQCTDHILEVLLYHNEWVSKKLVNTRLAGLLDKQQLLDTLRVYIQTDMSLQRAADELYVHPNTVSYRLKQIAQATGKDVRRLTDLIDLAISLNALDVLKINDAHGQGQMGLKTQFLSGKDITYD